MQYLSQTVLCEESMVKNVHVLEAVSDVELWSAGEAALEQLDRLLRLKVNSQAVEEETSSVSRKIVILGNG